jgi:hypothetical protein
VKTYQSNNGVNGASPPSIPNQQTVDDLYNQDITTPGFVRIHICGAEEAYKNWVGVQTGVDMSANYPCN